MANVYFRANKEEDHSPKIQSFQEEADPIKVLPGMVLIH